MMNIHGIQPPIAPRPTEPAGAVFAGNAKIEPTEISDVVEISTIAKLAAKVQEVPEVRAELVERVRDEIAAGTYETPERLEVALDGLMADLLPHLL